MIRAGIFGASGYTGSKLGYYLSRHNDVEISFMTSRQEKGKSISDIYGFLRGICDVKFSDPADIVDADIDVLFICAPDQVSMRIVPEYFDKGIAVIDLAGDYRMDSGEDYEKWYGKPHLSPGYIEKAVYGLTELNRERIANTKLVSNPGCYPTSVLLAILPLVKAEIIDCGSINVTSMSGISGAGRELKTFKQFYEVDSNIMPYGLGRSHKHTGEMEQELSKVAGENCTVIFSPHVVPLKTGIVSTILVTLKEGVTEETLDTVFNEMYGNEFFVRYTKNKLPESKNVADTNFCDIGFAMVKGTDKAVVVSTICNLGKGASGQAVQNMNVMFGMDEKEGLL
ncbi:N-acetyl-gamma-glutamyl-phosphate reductase [Candidatus Latescibacterota bacterium]